MQIVAILDQIKLVLYVPRIVENSDSLHMPPIGAEAFAMPGMPRARNMVALPECPVGEPSVIVISCPHLFVTYSVRITIHLWREIQVDCRDSLAVFCGKGAAQEVMMSNLRVLYWSFELFSSYIEKML